jgi:hypothetical protein
MKRFMMVLAAGFVLTAVAWADQSFIGSGLWLYNGWQAHQKAYGMSTDSPIPTDGVAYLSAIIEASDGGGFEGFVAGVMAMSMKQSWYHLPNPISLEDVWDAVGDYLQSHPEVRAVLTPEHPHYMQATDIIITVLKRMR